MINNCLLLYFFSISACMLAGIVGREAIDGGTVATRDNEFPYQVSLRVRDHNHSCGGAIISRDSILTSANCVVMHGSVINARMTVLIGTHHLHRTDPPAKIFQIKKIYVPIEHFLHSSNNNPVADIAVLKLLSSETLVYHGNPFNSDLQLGIPGSNYTGVTAVIAGWGLDYQLQYAEARVLSHRQCQGMHHPRLIDDDSLLCAKVKHESGSRLRGVCHGDEGGPLVYDGSIVGVLSLIAPYCDEMPSSAIYSRVSHYLRFIVRAIRNQNDENRRTYELTTHQ